MKSAIQYGRRLGSVRPIVPPQYGVVIVPPLPIVVFERSHEIHGWRDAVVFQRRCQIRSFSSPTIDKNQSTSSTTCETSREASTTIEETSSDTTTREDWLAAVTRYFKEGTVEEAVEAFRLHCIQSSDETDASMVPSSDFALIAVLNTLHKSPQQAEAFVKELQETNGIALTDTHGDEKNNDEMNEVLPWRPSKEHYHMVIQGWMDFDPPSAKRAQALLEYMNKVAGIPCELDSCNLVLEAWVRKKNAEGAQAFFDQIMMGSREIRPNFHSFAHLLEGWAKSKSPLAAKRADHLLAQMKHWKIEPNAECLSRVIECWAKSKRKGAETRIESLLAWMQRRLEKDECDPAVVQDSMWNLLQAYRTIRNAHRAEELLLDFSEQYRQIQRFPPTLQMCNLVLSIWSQSNSSRRGYRAEKLLLKMENDAVFPDPTVASYTAVLNCYAGSNKPDSAARAEALLRRMEQMERIEPTLASYTCVLIAWARSLDTQAASSQAERIFQDLQDRGFEPDRFVYSGLITAWGRCNREESIIKAEEYLQRIKDLSTNTNRPLSLKPTVVEYTGVLQAYANFVVRNVDRSRMVAERVDSLLNEMLDSEDVSLRPNTLTYAAALKAIAGARQLPDRGDRADAVLRTMYEQQVEISPYIMGLAKKSYVREPKEKKSGTDSQKASEGMEKRIDL
ncbi:PPR: pentatricopeptide repeat domain containing protein [Nitzschia inconspicua]|uniref:PPR: pentatricopeptide repeat domain containing protein n=1 Tax=Nitzschia inconspicua TaxID=303405 RepID=A0A9K3KNG8_9STRA|nr:PPR: pentatricopeptide repeat domain containing protein [Nitzschia inconspicua]